MMVGATRDGIGRRSVQVVAVFLGLKTLPHWQTTTPPIRPFISVCVVIQRESLVLKLSTFYATSEVCPITVNVPPRCNIDYPELELLPPRFTGT
jgi:hypothetical protein